MNDWGSMNNLDKCEGILVGDGCSCRLGMLLCGMVRVEYVLKVGFLGLRL